MMSPALSALLGTLRTLFWPRAALQPEVLALRHQLLVLKRQCAGRRIRFRKSDRVFWSLLSRVWSGWRHALILVRPETVVRWHRQGFRLYWRWKSRSRSPGRSPIEPDRQAPVASEPPPKIWIPRVLREQGWTVVDGQVMRPDGEGAVRRRR